MLPHRFYLSLAVAAGLAAPASGQAPVVLKWQFRKSVPFSQEVKTTTQQTMKVMGMDVTQSQIQSFTFSWTPVREDPATGNWTIKQKIEAVKMEIEIAGNKIQYDSTNDTGQTGNSLSDFFRALVGSEFELIVSPDMKILEIKGRNAFINKLIKANPQMEPLLKTILSDEALKQTSDSAFAPLPQQPVRLGDTWTNRSFLNMGPIGGYEISYKYTYLGKDENCRFDVIKMESTLIFQTPDPKAAAARPFPIKKADLQSRSATGAVYFDSGKHRLDHSEMRIILTGKLTIDISGMPSDIDLNQVQDTTVRTFAENEKAGGGEPITFRCSAGWEAPRCCCVWPKRRFCRFLRFRSH
jgi:hypothetical protein